jgi:ferredoxin
MRVSVDKSRCAASTFCVRIAPMLFELDGDGLSSPVLDGEIPPELEEVAEEAENACPASAILIEK